VLPLGFVAAAAVPLAAAQSTPAARPKPTAPKPAAEAPRQIVVTAPSAIAYGCAAETCREITQIEKGTVLSVLKTDRDWYQVMVRVGATSMTTGWLKTGQVAATADAATRAPAASGATASMLGGPATPAAPAEEDPRGCLTCMATRQPSPDEWNAALAETAKVKGRPADPAVAPGIVDARPDAERMRERATQRYSEELTRLGKEAGAVDNSLRSYLALCVERFASIPVAGAAPRSTSVDDMLKAARATPGAARFALWNGTATFQWNESWDPKPDPTSTLPSCPTIWEDVRSRAERLKFDLEALERDAQEQRIFPGVVRDLLGAYNLAEPTQAPPTPLTDIR
jgi:uncharacterized protein YgiM (DUF1202 family)